MQYEQWEPLYQHILSDMGYSKDEDERSARLLAGLVSGMEIVEADSLKEFFQGQSVDVCGAGSSLEESLLSTASSGKIIAAGSATRYLMETGLRPDMVVTDLDGDIRYQLEASREGAICVIHAHGDNMHLLSRHVKEFTSPILPTTQSRPFPPLHNYGGFTDGDRAVCMAVHFQASVKLRGFDFDSPRETDPLKRKLKGRKLAWAKEIVATCLPGFASASLNEL
jgi:uncharacterized Rossmann fold enzyme